MVDIDAGGTQPTGWVHLQFHLRAEVDASRIATPVFYDPGLEAWIPMTADSVQNDQVAWRTSHFTMFSVVFRAFAPANDALFEQPIKQRAAYLGYAAAHDDGVATEVRQDLHDAGFSLLFANAGGIAVDDSGEPELITSEPNDLRQSCDVVYSLWSATASFAEDRRWRVEAWLNAGGDYAGSGDALARFLYQPTGDAERMARRATLADTIARVGAAARDAGLDGLHINLEVQSNHCEAAGVPVHFCEGFATDVAAIVEDLMARDVFCDASEEAACVRDFRLSVSTLFRWDTLMLEEMAGAGASLLVDQAYSLGAWLPAGYRSMVASRIAATQYVYLDNACRSATFRDRYMVALPAFGGDTAAHRASVENLSESAGAIRGSASPGFLAGAAIYSVTGRNQGALRGDGGYAITPQLLNDFNALFLGVPDTPIAITVTVVGNGRVTSAPAGIDCGAGHSACRGIRAGSDVELTAVPEAGNVLSGWQGACAGTDACQLDGARGLQVTATFVSDGRSEVGEFPPFSPDPSDTLALAVVQTVPANGATNVALASVITVFFDDEVDPASLNDVAMQLVRTPSGDPVFGRFSGALSAGGNTILSLQPFAPLEPAASYSVSLASSSGVVDDGGNGLGTFYSFTFATASANVDSPLELGFETQFAGWGVVGAAGTSEAFGPVSPTEGVLMAAMSTGDAFSGSASGGSSSTLGSGPIAPTGANMEFDYDFLSEEFDGFVGQIYDDAFTVTVSGPLGSRSILVTSVNLVGTADSQPVDVPGHAFEHTGWQTASVDISGLGDPVRISYLVTDVGDIQYDTVVLIDNLRFH